MTATHLSIRVDLVSGRGEDCWPRPGRIFVAARSNTFAELADAIDTAFSRWDRAHLWAFDLADGTRPTILDPYGDWDPPGSIDGAKVKLSRLAAGEQFVYTFDFGDDWTHLCTVGEKRVDPDEVWGGPVERPMPYWGWGTIPDQYGRRWDADDGESPVPPAPEPPGSDLPPLMPWWGPRDR
jgi:Plasmid pRiA4b ORF-3-like protein